MSASRDPILLYKEMTATWNAGSLQNRYVEALTLGISDCNSTQQSVFTDVIKLKLGYQGWFNPYHQCPSKKGEFGYTDKHRGKLCEDTEGKDSHKT